MITRKAFSRLRCPPGRNAANSASHRYADRDEVIGNTDDANLVDLPVSALLFAPGRHPGQVIGAVPGDRRARRVQGGELGGGQRDRQRAKVLLDA
jgi:hypothetical protein